MQSRLPLTLKLYYGKNALIGALKSVPEQAYFTMRPCPHPSSTTLLAGSGRSGTTWLADMLTMGTRTQQIFEPLHPYWIPEVRKLAGWTKELHRMRLLYLRPDGVYPEWEALLTRVLSGRVRSWGWTDYQRTSYFPERYLIKMIRANLMLGYLYNTFHLPIIYIMRHPCAVTLSRLQTKSFCNVGDLLAQETLVEDHLRPWVGEIEGARDRLGALAVWWAVENRVAQRQLQSIPHLLLTYEDLILEPEREFNRAFAFLGLTRLAPYAEAIQTPSRTSRGAVYASAVERLGHWQNKLSDEEQKRILSWAHRLGVDLYDQGLMPTRAMRADSYQVKVHGD